jgi:hypothetical protein
MEEHDRTVEARAGVHWGGQSHAGVDGDRPDAVLLDPIPPGEVEQLMPSPSAGGGNGGGAVGPADDRNREARDASGIGGRFSNGNDGKMRELGESGAGATNGVGASQQQRVEVGRVGRGPANGREGEQRHGIGAPPLLARRGDGAAVARLRAQHHQMALHPANKRRISAGARASRSAARRAPASGPSALPSTA